MTVKEIIKEYLKTNGYGGLYSGFCGCEMEDLFPCGEYCGQCEPGYKVLVPEDEREYDECLWDEGWFITPKKPEGKNDKN